MNNPIIALPDGNGCFGTEQFWSDYFESINCQYYDKTASLNYLCTKSDTVFPKNTCLNSKYRLGRSLILSDKATHFLMFLRNDPYVSNCPSSIYRIKWIREYFDNIKVIVWKRDILEKGTDTENLIKLAEILKNDNQKATEFIRNKGIENLPKRKAVYNFSLQNINKNKKTILLIGVAPHILDKYRRSNLVDFILSKVNIIDPTAYNSNCMLSTIKNNEIVFYKDDAIINSCKYFLDNKLIDGIIFVSDPFDIPGRYSFPIYKYYFNKNGITEFRKENKNRISYLDLVVSLKNQFTAMEKIDEYLRSI